MLDQPRMNLNDTPAFDSKVFLCLLCLVLGKEVRSSLLNVVLHD